MTNIINEHVKQQLCPDGIWQFSDLMESVYKTAIKKFPLRETSEEQERYPTTKNGMGAYLDKFFCSSLFSGAGKFFRLSKF